MLTRRQRQAARLFAVGCVLLVGGILLWVASGSPTTANICDEGGQAQIKECSTYNIILVAGWHIAKAFHSIEGLITALATAAIALFTWTLWQSSERMWDATNRNTEALIKAENAQLWITISNETVANLVATYGRFDQSESMFGDELESPTVAYSFKNFGRTAAILKEISNQIISTPTFPQPAEHVIRESMPEELVIEPGHPSATLICIMKDTFTVGEAVRFQKRKTVIWFYGWVKFDDAFGREHQLDFRFCYRRGFGRFRLEHYREWIKEADG